MLYNFWICKLHLIFSTYQKQAAHFNMIMKSWFGNYNNVNFMQSYNAKKMKFSIKDFFSKCNQIRSFWSHLLKKSLMENFIFCAMLLSPERHLICLLTQSTKIKEASKSFLWVDLKNRWFSGISLGVYHRFEIWVLFTCMNQSLFFQVSKYLLIRCF